MLTIMWYELLTHSPEKPVKGDVNNLYPNKRDEMSSYNKIDRKKLLDISF